MNTQFASVEFEKMMFNPTRVPDGGNILEEFPILKKYKIFNRQPWPKASVEEKTRVMQWIMAVYDQHTPYRISIADMNKRKIEAGRDVGFEIDDRGVFSETIENMMRGMNKTVNAKIVEFVRMHRSPKYSYLVALETSYYNLLTQIMDGDSKNVKDLRNIQTEMESVLDEVLNKDENFILRKTVYRYMEEERLALRPEDIAMKLMKGEDPILDSEIWREG